LSKKKSATQDRIKEIWDTSEKLSELYRDKIPFDFVCLNAECPHMVSFKKAAIATAWQIGKNHYGVFCVVCGHEAKISNKEMKYIARKNNPQDEIKKITKADPEYYDEFEESRFKYAV
jgi:hypothetical protein